MGGKEGVGEREGELGGEGVGRREGVGEREGGLGGKGKVISGLGWMSGEVGLQEVEGG